MARTRRRGAASSNSLIRFVCFGAILYGALCIVSQSTRDRLLHKELLASSTKLVPPAVLPGKPVRAASKKPKASTIEQQQQQTAPSIPTEQQQQAKNGFRNNNNNNNTPSHRNNTTNNVGVLSHKDTSFFRSLQDAVDKDDPVARCLRYHGTYDPQMIRQRRIFYGSLIADESTELLEIVSTEAYGIYHAMVFVESNRTQNFTPRTMVRSSSSNHKEEDTLRQLFGVPRVDLRTYVNEDNNNNNNGPVDEMHREHLQRQEIIVGWKALGMTDADVGLIADADETFTRDFLRAVQTCRLDLLDAATHDCQHKHVKLSATTLVFESSPECPVDDREWFHPDMILGHCIDGISSHHPPAPRLNASYERAVGYGSDCSDWDEEDAASKIPHSWDAADFRRTCGGRQVDTHVRDPAQWHLSRYTGFHFHNFFTDAASIRFKYSTYGHFNPDAAHMELPRISHDLHLMAHCVKGENDHDEQEWKRVKGGFDALKPQLPIYFQDADYRARRHDFTKQLVIEDEKKRNRENSNNLVEDSNGANTIDVNLEFSDASLRTSVITGADSSNATVMALASGYDITVYHRFVGSLRKTGYKGHIILGVAPDVPKDIVDYLRSRNVMYKRLRWVNCSYDLIVNDGKPAQCAYPYSDIKTRWSRFPLARDWLRDCSTCTGPVLVMDARDSLFQRDPFAHTVVKGLHVFQEHLNQTTQHWLAKHPIEKCKGLTFHKTMLCSGTTAGTRNAMLQYLSTMYQEMKRWIVDPKCRFQMNGDDQSIHNYLFYSGQLPYATSIPNRGGGIVNTAGFEGAVLAKRHFAYWKETEGLEKPQARYKPYHGATDRTWIGPEFNVANADGLFTEFDGSVSRVVHQWDRFHFMYEHLWLKDQKWASDKFAEERPNPVIQIVPRRLPSVIPALPPGPNTKQLSETETGISVSDPELYATTETSEDTSSSTVIALASGYDLRVYQRFVGSLRKTGYSGHIILGVAPDIDERSRNYLEKRNVKLKPLQWVNCTYDLITHTGKALCAAPYNDIKTRWGRFPLARDWLDECSECTGPVIVMDARDSIFQRDPFAHTHVTGLQVFQEHVNMTTQNWLAQWPISQCRNQSYHQPMLCSGTTVGTRAAMLRYLDIMYAEMKRWIVEPNCRFDIHGDDQSIHNYLYYSGQLPFATSFPNRGGGIVNTIGHHGSTLADAHFAHWKAEKGLDKPEAKRIPYPGANDRTWIGPEYNLTDANGLFTNFDGSISRVVHQWDRFHFMYENWLDQQDWSQDSAQ